MILELPLRLERGRQPLHLQLADQLRSAIRKGLLTPGTRLPSTRSVSVALGVSRKIVVSAYEELFSEGFLVGRTGSGTYVEQSLPRFPRALSPPPSHTPRWLHRHEQLVGEEASWIPPEPGVIVFRLGTLGYYVDTLSLLHLCHDRTRWDLLGASSDAAMPLLVFPGFIERRASILSPGKCLHNGRSCPLSFSYRCCRPCARKTTGMTSAWRPILFFIWQPEISRCKWLKP